MATATRVTDDLEIASEVKSRASPCVSSHQTENEEDTEYHTAIAALNAAAEAKRDDIAARAAAVRATVKPRKVPLDPVVINALNERGLPRDVAELIAKYDSYLTDQPIEWKWGTHTYEISSHAALPGDIVLGAYNCGESDGFMALSSCHGAMYPTSGEMRQSIVRDRERKSECMFINRTPQVPIESSYYAHIKALSVRSECKCVYGDHSESHLSWRDEVYLPRWNAEGGHLDGDICFCDGPEPFKSIDIKKTERKVEISFELNGDYWGDEDGHIPPGACYKVDVKGRGEYAYDMVLRLVQNFCHFKTCEITWLPPHNKVAVVRALCLM